MNKKIHLKLMTPMTTVIKIKLLKKRYLHSRNSKRTKEVKKSLRRILTSILAKSHPQRERNPLMNQAIQMTLWKGRRASYESRN